MTASTRRPAVPTGRRPAVPAAGPALGRAYAIGVGILLVALGLLGFVDNPLIGDPDTNPLIVTGTVHDMIHLATGFLALYIAFALADRAQADGLIAFGVLFLALVGVTLVSPNLFGVLGPSPGYNVNATGHLLHLLIGVASLALGLLLRRATPGAPAGTASPAG